MARHGELGAWISWGCSCKGGLQFTPRTRSLLERALQERSHHGVPSLH